MSVGPHVCLSCHRLAPIAWNPGEGLHRDCVTEGCCYPELVTLDEHARRVALEVAEEMWGPLRGRSAG